MNIFEKVSYDKDANACYISIKKDKIESSESVKPWLIVDKNKHGEIIWLEILSANKHMSLIEKLLLSQEKIESCVLS